MQIGDPFRPYRFFTGVLVTPDSLARYKGLSPGAKLIWSRLARYQGETGEVFPSISTLGAETGLSRRQAFRYVRELERAGFILVIPSPGQVNRFEFLWHAAFEGDTGRQRKKDGTHAVNGRTSTPPSAVNVLTTSAVNGHGTPDVYGHQRESLEANHLKEGHRRSSIYSSVRQPDPRARERTILERASAILEDPDSSQPDREWARAQLARAAA